MVFEEPKNQALESAYNESELAMRRQDIILREINRIAYEVSSNKAEYLRPYLSSLERLYMELSYIHASSWNLDKDKNIWSKPPELIEIEKLFNLVNEDIEELSRPQSQQKIGEMFPQIQKRLKFIELFLRRKKQIHGMGIKREESIDEESRLDTAFGL